MLRQAAAALTRRAVAGFRLGSLPQLIPPRPPAPLMQRASASTFVRTSESGRLTRKVTHYRSPRHTKTRVQRVMEHPTQSLIGMTTAGLVAGALSALAMEDSRADAEAVALVKSPLAKSPLSSSSSSSSAITRGDSIKEAATGIVFPLRLDADPHISSPSQQLIATGCTYRMLGLFAVYAVGMYMDVSSARRNLKIDYMQGANTVDSLLSDPKFFNSIINDFRVSSRLTLKMNRQVDANDMTKSLRDSVKPHVMQRNEASVPALEKMCTALRKRLGTEGAKPGLELSFVFFQGGRTYVLVDGVQVPEAEVTDWAVSSSILESFIGAGAEAPDLRVAVAKGFLEQVLQ